VEGVALLAALAIAALVSITLVRRGRRPADAALDRTARQRIAERVAVISHAQRASGQVTAPGGVDRGSPATPSRRILWRDTSAVLMVLGVGLIAVLIVIEGPGSPGAVLQETATPGLWVAHASSDISLEAPALETDAPSPLPSSAPSPTISPSPTADASTAEPSVTATPEPTVPPPTSDRFAVLTPCPNKANCFIYVVRRGDNLVSIANWFGIPYETVLGWNPRIDDPSTIVAGDRITLPTPRR
jgi:hypothetical protein